MNPTPDELATRAADALAAALGPTLTASVQAGMAAAMAQAGMGQQGQPYQYPMPWYPQQDDGAAAAVLFSRRQQAQTAPAPQPGLDQDVVFGLGSGSGTGATAALAPGVTGEPQQAGRFRVLLTTGAAGLPAANGEYTALDGSWPVGIPLPPGSRLPVFIVNGDNAASRAVRWGAAPIVNTSGPVPLLTGVRIYSEGAPLLASTAYYLGVVTA